MINVYTVVGLPYDYHGDHLKWNSVQTERPLIGYVAVPLHVDLLCAEARGLWIRSLCIYLNLEAATAILTVTCKSSGPLSVLHIILPLRDFLCSWCWRKSPCLSSSSSFSTSPSSLRSHVGTHNGAQQQVQKYLTLTPNDLRQGYHPFRQPRDGCRPLLIVSFFFLFSAGHDHFEGPKPSPSVYP